MKDKKGYIKWIVFLVTNTIVVFSWILIRFYYKFIDLNIQINIPFAMDFLPTFVLSALFSITDKVNIKKKLINFFMRIIIGMFVVFVVYVLYATYMLSKFD